MLKGATLRTLHLKERNKQVLFGNLTEHGANRLMAYEGYCDGMTVKQHFYGRHRIRLVFPKLPCVVVYGNNGHNSYYPLEVLTLSVL